MLRLFLHLLVDPVKPLLLLLEVLHAHQQAQSHENKPDFPREDVLHCLKPR